MGVDNWLGLKGLIKPWVVIVFQTPQMESFLDAGGASL